MFLLKPLYAYAVRWMAWLQGKPLNRTKAVSGADGDDSDNDDSDDDNGDSRSPTTEQNFLKLDSEEEWDKLMEKESRPVIGYFTGSWCKPCKATTPHLQQLSETHRDVVFVSVDAAKFTTIHEAQEVFALPTTKAYKFGKAQGSVSGANIDAITTLVAKAAA